MDNYVEHLVKRKDPGYFSALKLLMIAVDAAMAFLALTTLWGILLLILAGVGTYMVWLYAKVEYEYLYMGGTLTVDQVLNQQRRKKLLETNGEELVVIAPKNSMTAKDQMGTDCKVMDLSGAGEESRKFAYIYVRGGQKTCLYLDVPEKLLKEMRLHTPSKVKLQ